MSKLYATINTELIDPDLEAKIDLDIKTEPTFVDIPTDLYAAIVSNVPDTNAEVTTEIEGKQFAYSVLNRLYTQIIPEKPSILAEERIFVYVPKVAYGSAGIAKFATGQFNVINGEVSLKPSYLAEMLASNLIKPELILIVTVLPAVGLANRIYLLPIDSTTCAGYIWGEAMQNWQLLGSVALELANYYTKAETQALITGSTTSINGIIVFNTLAEANASNVPLGTYAFIKVNNGG